MVDYLSTVSDVAFRYTFNVSHILASAGEAQNRNLTVSFESAYLYGLNVSSRPDAEYLIASDVVRMGLLQIFFEIADDSLV